MKRICTVADGGSVHFVGLLYLDFIDMHIYKNIWKAFVGEILMCE